MRPTLAAAWTDGAIFDRLGGKTPPGAKFTETVPPGVPVQTPNGTAYVQTAWGARGGAQLTLRLLSSQVIAWPDHGARREDLRSLVHDILGTGPDQEAMVDRLEAEPFQDHAWSGSHRVEALHAEGNSAWTWSTVAASRSWSSTNASFILASDSLGQVHAVQNGAPGSEMPSEAQLRSRLDAWGIAHPAQWTTQGTMVCAG
jgi:hypothetical protein